MPNRLALETSPYLQQHADNPVDWHAWNPESLRLAREQDKPILLSIGYSACHWCHVMAHESFEDAEVAAVMNELFVNIKVDREERPDLDQIYQSAHQLLTQRSGGWPLTMFLGPDGTPFFGGTYFPKQARYGLPAFPDLLRRVAQVYAENRAELAEQGEHLIAALARSAPKSNHAELPLHDAPLALALKQNMEHYDSVHGGLGGAPKFLHPAELDLLLRRGHATGDEQVLHAVNFTLRQMARGGLYDQLGGGFCRYSVDERWDIPHFEKMLYDNGLLLGLYSDAWQQQRRPAVRAGRRTDRRLGDARDAIPARRLLLFAGCRLGTRGRKILSVATRRGPRFAERGGIRRGRTLLRPGSPGQFREPRLEPAHRRVAGRNCAAQVSFAGAGSGFAGQRKKNAVRGARAARPPGTRRKDPGLMERADDSRHGKGSTGVQAPGLAEVRAAGDGFRAHHAVA